MKGRAGGGHQLGGVPADLLVCFPTRSRLALMPKPICSPSRPADPLKRNLSRPAPTRGRASSLSRAKTVKQMSPDMDEEPTSPKVTCAGQIKVIRPKLVPTVHNCLSRKKKQSWLEAFGLKRDIVKFFTARLRFNMGCFSSPAVDYTSDEEEDEDEEVSSTESGAIFSKWFMILDNESKDAELKEGKKDGSPVIETGPPANALLLMRCRSAPAKAKDWLEVEDEEGEGEFMTRNAKRLREEEKEKENLMLMSYAPDFFEVSMDVAKETWIEGGAIDRLARCRSWKR